MKAIKTMLALTVATGLAWAQVPATNKPKAPASQSVAGQAAPAQKPAAAPAAKPAAPATAQKPAAKAPAKKAAKGPAAAKAPAVKKPAAPAAKAEGAPAAPAAPKPTGKRDPFVNPVVRAAGGPGAVCATGKRCLMIGDMVLRGVVKTPSGMIAVVANQANRAYFLKENDPVFNGVVVKITADSVIFKENTVDNLGRETTREVVKRVSAPTV